MNNITTTQKGFRVEDITFKGMRRQSEIDKETFHNEESSLEITAPVSLTPEQVKSFYESKISQTVDTREKRVYGQTIKWIDDMLEYRKKLIAIEVKQSEVKDENTVEDIEE